jgi:hypothetical protein
VALSPNLQAIVDAITASHPGGLTLDELGEELLHRPVTYADIDEIIGALEAQGFDLEGPAPPAGPEDLARVLTAARALGAELGRRPTAAEIAERAALTPIAVRRALRLGGLAGG